MVNNMRSAWECIGIFLNAPKLLYVAELGMHSHAERGNEVYFAGFW